MALSIEGERLLKAQDYQGAINYFEAGLRAGTDDQEVLSAVYNQLGNACFYVGKFHKALEYHKKDLEIAQKLDDRNGQAKAYGNLGNTFKSLKNYANAVKCCESHLEITKELKDKLGEGRACYNLGNVHHAIGKAGLALKTETGTVDGRTSINVAIGYYKKTLEITCSLNDKSGEGRALGNLGNAYTAIGDYAEAITYHERRLELAVVAKDLAARARACGNLGNAYSALGANDSSCFTQALKYYQQSLAVAKDSNNVPGQGQAYYCIGSTYTMLKNHVKAIEYFEQHLEIATKLNDKTGMLRAWYNLRNGAHSTGDMARTVEYHKLIQKNQGSAPTPFNPKPSGASAAAKSGASESSADDATAGASDATAPPPEKGGKKGKKAKQAKEKKATKPKDNEVQAFSISDSESDDEDVQHYRNGEEPVVAPRKSAAETWLDRAISQVKDLPEGEALPSPDGDEDIFAAIAMPTMPEPEPTKKTNKKKASKKDAADTAPFDKTEAELTNDDDFFDLLVKMQGAQIDSQRSSRAPGDKAFDAPAEDIREKLTDDMDFFAMLAAAKN